MENASKALIMAGSVLIAILIISLLVVGYNKMAQLKQTEVDADNVDALAEYMRRFEQYNRGEGDAPLYGSEILSIANLQEDYNRLKANIDDGYSEIRIEVEITKDIFQQNLSKTYFTVGNHSILDILKDHKDLSDNLKEYKKPKYNQRSVAYYSTKSNLEIAMDFGVKFGPTDYNPETGRDLSEDIILNADETKNLMKDIMDYQEYKSVYDTFRNGKRFKCEKVTYSNYNGRLEYMKFKEI